MNRIQIANAALLGVFVTCSAKIYFDIRREEQMNRKRVEENLDLDIRAIARAADHVGAMIEAGQIRGLAQLTSVMNTEIAFQKIAIRED